ncbi:hypothetical protein [Streptomyces sp. NPDC059176]|uniref:hypothetical protein n=1 Tax=Streptomyces sp. NPDC059176 TaxID=3346758 RepID=UPI0036B59427
MRMLTSTGAVVAAAACSLLFAPSALATPHGDNGTVKIHDAATGEELRRNEPHVCSFYLDAFGFDGGQAVDWRIEAWAPTAEVKGREVTSGSVVLDASGHGRTVDLSLPDGHYTLFWTFGGERGRAKHKVFWAECDEESDTPPGEDGEPGGTPGDEPGGTPDARPSAPSVEPAPSTSVPSVPSAPPASVPAETVPGAEPSVPGDLAETGSAAPVGPLSAVAAALLVAGGWLAVHRRRSGRRA